MQISTLALLSAVVLSRAAPQFGIGDGSTILLPGGGTPPSNPGGPILLPPINNPIIRPGKREPTLHERTEDVEALEETYSALLKPFTDGNKPSFGTYMVLLHLADILASKGINADTMVLGEAITTFGPSTKRQIFEIGSCSDSDVIGLRATLTSLLLIYGNTPPFEIWNLEQAIIAALKACREDISVGPIIPDKPAPGGPLIPDKPIPGGPIVTQSPVPGGPIKPSD
ncbi:uncharacterized protein ColSpa_00529 [Colletotrichum spaethianum]|uniref:Uncharacterized protein n=1 Tax=Colletotrichum spaethianum TaxID=700344 RepID=A0AA37L1Q4_9PEZI|nr:uncharacterized protein ColSpa_00529 [Colletotrichum spaethianum]GKT40348.1 hypothetical protein ColSpa_00529 [Colletotrichum spaethianum]